MDQITKMNPLMLSCPSCGAPAEYDIKAGSCRCRYCGALSQPEEQISLVEKWRSVQQGRLRQEIHQVQGAMFSCRNCGAEIAVMEGEATGSCAFCGGALVRREFTNSDAFPELIIPFRLTLEEAKETLTHWAKKQSGKKREKALKNLPHLTGYYLPYQFVRGTLDCEVSRDRSAKRFYCSGYVDRVAINTSKQLSNIVLDAIEPFDWSESKPFSFGYIAGHRVKMRDITDAQLVTRVKTEVERDYLPIVEKTMETKGVELYMRNSALVQMPLLLPVYILQQKQMQIAVNGQTGAVAASFNEQQDSNRFWFIEPLLTTLVLAAVTQFFGKSLELTGMTALAVALVSFIAFGQDKQTHFRDRILGRKGSKTKDKGLPEVVPVFREQIKGEWQPVKVSFFPLFRVIRGVILLLLLSLSPLLLAMLMSFGGNPDGTPIPLHYSYLSIWLVLSIPLTFIIWIAYVRRDIYDHPVYHLILPNGKLKRVTPDSMKGSWKKAAAEIKGFLSDLLPTSIGMMFSGEGLLFFFLLVVLPVVMFVMSIVLMLGG